VQNDIKDKIEAINERISRLTLNIQRAKTLRYEKKNISIQTVILGTFENDSYPKW